MLLFSNTTLNLRTGGQIPFTGEIDIRIGAASLICGDNGSGKSVSLAAVAAALGSPSLSVVKSISGQVGTPARFKGAKVSMVRQEPLDNFIGRTPSDELVCPLLNFSYSEENARATLTKLITLLDVDRRLLRANVRALSGGERQLMSLCVAMATEPDVVILDEPTARLDRANAIKVLEGLRKLLPRCAVIIATHDSELIQGVLGEHNCNAHWVDRSGESISVIPTATTGRAGGSFAEQSPRRTPVVLPAAGERCCHLCPGDVIIAQKDVAQPLVDIADLDLRQGINVIWGDNGTGKTLLARCIAGHYHMNRGWTSTFRSMIGDLFGLLGSITASGSMAYVLPHQLGNGERSSTYVPFHSYRAAGRSIFLPAESHDVLYRRTVESEVRSSLREDEVHEVFGNLRNLGIGLDKPTSQLSVGQRKVLALFTIPRRARLLVIDEPLTGLSQRSREAVMEVLGRLGSIEDATVGGRCIVATSNRHDDAIALRECSNI